jgi:hypothetical protein
MSGPRHMTPSRFPDMSAAEVRLGGRMWAAGAKFWEIQEALAPCSRWDVDRIRHACGLPRRCNPSNVPMSRVEAFELAWPGQ